LITQSYAAAPPCVSVVATAQPSGVAGGALAVLTDALHTAYVPDGVLVLTDTPAARRLAEQAVTLLTPAMWQVRICMAPLVEGSMAAAQAICAGHALDLVCRTAEQAFHDNAPAAMTNERANFEAAPLHTQEIVVTVKNAHGLHARPAARFVQIASQFDARIQARKLGRLASQAISADEAETSAPVSALSLHGLTLLGIEQGDQIAIAAQGHDAQQALIALRRLVEAQFDGASPDAEGPAPRAAVSATPARRTSAGQILPLSEGIAAGRTFYYHAAAVTIPTHAAENPLAEWITLQEALRQLRETLEDRRREVREKIGGERAAIFDAQVLMLNDPTLLEHIRSDIFAGQMNAAAAWQKNIQALTESYRSLSNAYLQQRGNDVADVGNQVLALLLPDAPRVTQIPAQPGVLVINELTPTIVVQLASHVVGFIVRQGSPTDHSAILARALGIPAIAIPALRMAGSQEDNRAGIYVPDGCAVALDGFSGNFWLDPSPQQQAALQQRQDDWLQRREALLSMSQQPALTRDGQTVKIAANVGSVLDAEIALRNGAEGIGVLRTEFLYLARATPPSEVEHVEMLLQIAGIMGKHPIYVRTLDIGGDKVLPYLNLPTETNPFLGMRAIRLSLKMLDLFSSQLRAILRAGAQADVRLMFPMISKVEEILQARHYLKAAHHELHRAQIPHRWPIPLGLMVETPSAALIAPVLLEYVDYVSIGTNDLTQYTLAAERGNTALAAYADGLHPAVLLLIKQVVEAAREQGKQVGVCGELASDPEAVPVLLGLGVDEFSLNPASIPTLKAVIRNVHLRDATALAADALQQRSDSEVRRLVRAFMKAAALTSETPPETPS